MRLFLVRHGQTSWNVLGKAQGHTDIELDEVGTQQAELLAASMKRIQLSKVITSDLSRSRETARGVAIATGGALVERSDIRERGFGEWEGTNFEEVGRRMDETAKELGISRQHVRPPGGESFMDVWNRLDPFTEELFQETESIAVVAHGGTCSLLLAKLLKGSIDTSRGFRFRNASVTELERRPEGLFLMTRYGDVSHLDGLMKPSLAGSLEGVSR